MGIETLLVGIGKPIKPTLVEIARLKGVRVVLIRGADLSRELLEGRPENTEITEITDL